MGIWCHRNKLEAAVPSASQRFQLPLNFNFPSST
jgi:hypothetical protein